MCRFNQHRNASGGKSCLSCLQRSDFTGASCRKAQQRGVRSRLSDVWQKGGTVPRFSGRGQMLRKPSLWARRKGDRCTLCGIKKFQAALTQQTSDEHLFPPNFQAFFEQRTTKTCAGHPDGVICVCGNCGKPSCPRGGNRCWA